MGANTSNTRYQSARTAGITAERVPRLKLKWAFGFHNGTSSYGQPTIVSGRVFVGTDTGYVYSIDARTGCVCWSFRTNAGVRNAPVVASVAVTRQRRLVVFFGDVKANVYAVDAQSGAQVWVETNRSFDTVNKVAAKGGSISAPEPTVADGMVFVGSGYAVLGGIPGNVLLAFGLD